MSVKYYSLMSQGDVFVSPHFQVKEFADKNMDYISETSLVLIHDDLINKLELLSDCINNKAIIVDKGNVAERVEGLIDGNDEQYFHYNGYAAVIHSPRYLADDLSVLAEACGFSRIGALDKSKIYVDVSPGDRECFYRQGKTYDSDLMIGSFFDKFWENDDSWLHIRKIPFADIDHIEVMETREPVKTTVNKFSEYDLILNANFFCTFMEPQFNLKIHGRVLKNYPDHKWGMIFTKDRIRYGELSSGNTFISGHPVLLDNWGFCNVDYASEIDGFRQRAAIGYDNNNLYAVVCDAKPGLTLKGLRQIMKYIGCKCAINLDGGGSTSMGELGKIVNKQTDQRRVNCCIMIKKKSV